MKRRILAGILCLAVCLVPAISGCTKTPAPETTAAYFETQRFDDDYVLQWYSGSVEGSDGTVETQAPGYAFRMRSDAETIADISRFGMPNGTDGGTTDFSKLINLETRYGFSEGGTEYLAAYCENTAKGETFFRTLESGRYVQRKDVVGIGFAREGSALPLSRIQGRVEFLARQDYLVLTAELFSSAARSVELGVSFVLPEGFSLHGGAGVWTAADAAGRGIAFAAEDVSCALEGRVLSFRRRLDLPAGELSGLSIKLLPAESLGDGVAAAYFDGTVAVETEGVSPQGIAGISIYEPASGIIRVSVKGGMDYPAYFQSSFASEEKRAAYERIKFILKNAGKTSKRVLLSFEKAGMFSVYGFSPMIRDTETLEPVGEQVQISKNWHGALSSVPADDPANTWTGTWSHNYVMLEVPAGSERQYEYTCAYAEWGGIAPASHGQLSLAGWGGNKTWDQVALGTNGENICYAPQDTNSVIGDIRPMFTLGSLDEYRPYTWTGNIGGGDFLTADAGGTQKASDVKVYYHTQAPNLTDVTYRGVTSSKSIAFDYRLQLGRTDDTVRHFYTLTFEFLKDCDVTNLTFFSFNSDRYAKGNRFAKYAAGNAEKIAFDREYSYDGQAYAGSGVPQKFAAEGESPWFLLYDSTGTGEMAQERDGNNLLVVRRFGATLNGVDYTTPAYNVRQYQKDSVYQPCFELTLPADAPKRIEKGSRVQLCLEFVTLPGIAENYYGASGYMNGNKDKFNTADMGLLQARDALTAGAVTGALERGVSYASVRAAQSGAEFWISGGHGYVPVEISGLDGYGGWTLSEKRNGAWVPVDQSVNGGDFWQAKYDRRSGTYTLVFNVEAGGRREFRLAR